MSAPLENEPSDEQKRNLENWLSELAIICRRYRILPDTDDGQVVLSDMDAGTIVGLGLTYLTTEHAGQRRLTAMDCAGSILDGVWLLNRPDGLIEQRDVQNVFPAPGPTDLMED